MRCLLRRLVYIIRRYRLENHLAEEIEFHRVMKERELDALRRGEVLTRMLQPAEIAGPTQRTSLTGKHDF